MREKWEGGRVLGAYYGHIQDGQLKRLPYLGYCLLLTLIGIVVGIILSAFFSEGAACVFNLLIFLVLLLIPRVRSVARLPPTLSSQGAI